MLTCAPLENCNDKKSIKNTNWPHELCHKLATVICCPALQDRNLLLYAIKLAIHCRSKAFPAPDLRLIRSERSNAVIKQIQRQLEDSEFSSAEKQKLNSLLNKTKRTHKSAHTKFVQYIVKIANFKGHQGVKGARDDDDAMPGVRGRDIEAITKAWDIHAAKAEPTSGLNTIVEYHKPECKFRKDTSKRQVSQGQEETGNHRAKGENSQSSEKYRFGYW